MLESFKEYIKNAKASCVCYGDSLMIHDALAELLDDGFNIRYIIDDTQENRGGLWMESARLCNQNSQSWY